MILLLFKIIPHFTFKNSKEVKTALIINVYFSENAAQNA